MCASRGQTEARLLGLEKENQHLKAERRRLDHKMAQIQKCVRCLHAHTCSVLNRHKYAVINTDGVICTLYSIICTHCVLLFMCFVVSVL
jgi:hypothetical protein